MKQEQLIQLQIIEQEANQLEQQLQLIEQHLAEMQQLKDSLDELDKSEEKEILANIGKGIYIPAEIKSRELIVEIGGKNFVKKSILEAKEIIGGEMEKLINAKQQIVERVEGLRGEMGGLMNVSGK